jgi:hypothetical protein
MADSPDNSEEWRAIPFAPGYYASSFGRVRGRRGSVLKPFINRDGYSVQTFCVDGVIFKKATHFVVCTVFNGERPAGYPHCAHRDGDKLNNRPVNLRWATAKENAEDGIRLGRYYRGDEHWTHKRPECLKRGDEHHGRRRPDRVLRGSAVYNAALTEAQVADIRAAVKRGAKTKDLASLFGVSIHVISDVRRGRSYRQV